MELVGMRPKGHWSKLLFPFPFNPHLNQIIREYIPLLFATPILNRYTPVITRVHFSELEKSKNLKDMI
jgi:hypothetical protein